MADRCWYCAHPGAEHTGEIRWSEAEQRMVPVPVCLDGLACADRQYGNTDTDEDPGGVPVPACTDGEVDAAPVGFTIHQGRALFGRWLIRELKVAIGRSPDEDLDEVFSLKTWWSLPSVSVADMWWSLRLLDEPADWTSCRWWPAFCAAGARAKAKGHDTGLGSRIWWDARDAAWAISALLQSIEDDTERAAEREAQRADLFRCYGLEAPPARRPTTPPVESGS